MANISQELREIQYKKAVKSLHGLFLKIFQIRETKFLLSMSYYKVTFDKQELKCFFIIVIEQSYSHLNIVMVFQTIFNMCEKFKNIQFV